MRVGLVLVHYHTPELACAAVDALREDVAGSANDPGIELTIVLVDNGSTAEGRRLLETLDSVKLVDPGRNLGYAGAFNRGVAELHTEPHTESPDVLVVMNPDVRVLPGCLAGLIRALDAGAGVAGPRFWWDRRGGFLLPPTERRGRLEGLRRFLAPRLGATPARRAWRRHVRRHWLSGEPLPSHALSGALLAITAEAWRRVGPFDDAYRLYFEETDWLERARRAGVAGVYAPGAEALHAYAQSTAKQGDSARWFVESHRRFRRRHYGRLFTAGLEGAARLWPEKTLEKTTTGPTPAGLPSQQELTGADWLEVAASPLGFPAAGLRLDGDELPPLPDGTFWLRALRGEEELFVRRIGAQRGA